MEKEYVVIIDVTEQVSEDQYKVRTKTLKVTGSTTVADIEAWYKKHRPESTIEFKLTELETTVS